MKLLRLLFIILFSYSAQLLAQFPGMGGFGKGRSMNVGRVYGKVQDSVTGKSVEYVVVQVFGTKFDTVSKTRKVVVLTGDLTKSNGDFSLENLPVFGEITIKFSAIGYLDFEKKFSFNIDIGQIMKQRGQNNGSNQDGQSSSPMGALNAIDKDIGNIKLKPNAKLLKGVTIEADRPEVEIKLDKKIYNVEKMLTISGGTAEDALKNIPSVVVDLDGNVSMRNASPQIFVDGRPTTLTIDQIPADAIESIEVISNPSAKYDASGGMAGIINIVLKKNRKTGYNGGVRAGIDSHYKTNASADFNVREGKVNAFVSAGFHQRGSIGLNITDRNNLSGSPLLDLHQNDPTSMDGYFGFARMGFDYFMSNRNTITVSGNLGTGFFKNYDQMTTNLDTLHPSFTTYSQTFRNTVSQRNFQNLGASVLFKHLFVKEGKELTADVNYNSNGGGSTGNYQTYFYDVTGNGYRIPVQQKQDGNTQNQFITAQTDFVSPWKTNMKVEAGLRASVKNYISSSNSYLYDDYTSEFIQLRAFGVNYTFSDQVYAAYGTFSQEFKKFSYQAGLRVESSLYHGNFADSTTTYSYQYPLIPFPSVFATYHLNESNDIQLSATRRINRPSFFQLIPATDYSDSLNIRRGNPGLKPEFTNSVELSYLKTFSRGNTFMFSGFYKQSTDLITNYQLQEYNAVLHHPVIINTYENALTSNSYGAELTARHSIKKIIDFTANVNLYYSEIDASNVTPGLINKRFNWFAKLSTTIHLPKNMSLQFTGDYTAKSNLSLNSGGGGRWGGMGGGFGGGGYNVGSTAQGYTLPVYYIDGAFKIDLLKDRKLSVTLNCADILKSRIIQTHSESPYFVQDNSRRRDQLFFRLNLSWRFGKFDVSLFKRKNNKVNTEGMDMSM